MMTVDFSSHAIGWAAIATGIAGLLGLAFLLLFFTIGQPFGALNDICIGVTGIASGVLAWMLYTEHHGQSPVGQLALILALAGAIVVAIGSVLVVFRITGWYLAGLYMAVGNALIGLWLVGLNYSVQPGTPLSHGPVTSGRLIGVVMALGLAALPGIFRGLDAWDAAPWYINYVGLPASIGYLALFPTWCVFMGRMMLAG
jgi:hypothetical protein